MSGPDSTQALFVIADDIDLDVRRIPGPCPTVY